MLSTKLSILFFYLVGLQSQFHAILSHDFGQLSALQMKAQNLVQAEKDPSLTY